MSPPRSGGRVCLLPPGWGEAVPHLSAARREEQEASASLLCRDLPSARAALLRAAEAARQASEALRRLAAEVEGHDVDGKLPDWEE